MKRIAILLFILIFLLCSCSTTAEKSTTNTSNSKSEDLSYENINELADFKCYISHNDNIVTIEGYSAKELYNLIGNAKGEEIQTSTYPDGDYVYLVFYNSTEEYPSKNANEFYGAYTIYDNGILNYSRSPYHSAAFNYKLNSNIFNSIINIMTS